MSEVLFLGTGASLGVPVAGCPCEVCHSQDPKNKRLRTSILLEIDGKKILVDAGPDLRQQALKFGITKLDGVIFTHSHQDHTGGIDELRVFYFKNQSSLPCLVSKETAEDIRRRFYFMLEVQPKEVAGTKRLELVEVPGKQGEVNFLGVPVNYFTYDQVGMGVFGLRFGKFAYLTDVKTYPESIFKWLEGVEILVISALRLTSSHMHLTVDEAVDFVNRVKPKKAYLTHLSHELDYEKTTAYLSGSLPNGIQLAYDGLRLNF